MNHFAKTLCESVLFWFVSLLAVGPLCVLMETANSEIMRQSCGPLQPYVNSLVRSSSCNSGEPGQFLWSPDETTPDVVYYQVKFLKPFRDTIISLWGWSEIPHCTGLV